MKRRFGVLFTLAVPLAMAGFAAAWLLNMLPGALRIGTLNLGAPAAVVYETAVANRGTIRKIISTAGPVRACGVRTCAVDRCPSP